MFKKSRFIIVIQQLAIAGSLMLLAGCSALDKRPSLVLLPAHIENMGDLVMNEEERQLLHESLSLVIDEQEYHILNREMVDLVLEARHKQDCDTLGCQTEAAALFRVPFFASVHLSQHENSYALSITVTEKRNRLQKTKYKKTKGTREGFLDLVHEIRLMEKDTSWVRGWRPESRVKMIETEILETENSPRTHEEISLDVDRYKSRLLAIYQRALRGNPSLRGQVVFKVTIEVSGKVSRVEVVSSALNDERLERKLAARFKMFKFGARDVDTMIVTIPIDFYPS